MANYSVDKKLLYKYLPYKTEIDFWKDTCYVSLVGFMFMNTKIKGFKIPFHKNFEEVNLRFYVRHKDKDSWKRGVVFIKEIVPKYAVSFIANIIYNENYETMPMSHLWEENNDSQIAEYKWKKKKWNSIKVIGDINPGKIEKGSMEEFITEHYWGYTKINEKKTSEYQVVHPRWEVYKIRDYSIDVDFGEVYGKNFEFLKMEKPKSVFLAEGSEVKVKEGDEI